MELSGSGRSASIGDVARLAGVSVPTVSRVLTGAARVSEQKRVLVQAAIEKLEYRPSGAARVLASNRPRAIAVLASATSIYGYAETIRGIEEGARSGGYAVTITVIGSPKDDEVEIAIALALAQPVVGAIILKYDRSGVAAIKRIPSYLPLVCIGGSQERRNGQVEFDAAPGSYQLTKHLLGLGHRTVHHIAIPSSGPEDGRTRGWRKALNESGAPVPAIYRGSWSPESGRALGATIAADRDVTAVFCGNDEIAIGLLRGLRDQGLEVPRDISVVGFDDHPLAEMAQPSLTTVHQDFAMLGRDSVQMLLELSESWPSSARRISTPQVIFRESTGSASKRSRIAKAGEFR